MRNFSGKLTWRDSGSRIANRLDGVPKDGKTHLLTYLLLYFTYLLT